MALQVNLNESIIDSDHNYPDIPTNLQSHKVIEVCKVETCFRNLEERLIQEIEQADCVVGCVAWLTSEKILKALATCKAVSIIVQKEDFLRPDLASYPNWAARLRKHYKALRGFGWRYDVGGTVGCLSVCGDPTISAVRCVGNLNSDKDPAFPRMHNKFALFCNFKEEIFQDDVYEERRLDICPYKVWTGSFNFTHNGTHSLENAVLIEGDRVAEAYYEEWEQIVALSEPLDWDTPWMAPEWRIGT